MTQNSKTKNVEHFNHCGSQFFWDGLYCADDNDDMCMSLFHETFKDHAPTLEDLESLFCGTLRCETAVVTAVNLIGLEHYGLINIYAFTVIENFHIKDEETVDVSKLRLQCFEPCYCSSVLRPVSNFLQRLIVLVLYVVCADIASFMLLVTRCILRGR